MPIGAASENFFYFRTFFVDFLAFFLLLGRSGGISPLPLPLPLGTLLKYGPKSNRINKKKIGDYTVYQPVKVKALNILLHYTIRIFGVAAYFLAILWMRGYEVKSANRYKPSALVKNKAA